MTSIVCYLLLGLLLPGQSPSPRIPACSVLLLDGRTIQGSIKDGTIPGQLRIESDGKPLTVDSADVDRIDVQFEKLRTQEGVWKVSLLNGSKLAGQIISGGGEKLTLRETLLGTIGIPLEHLQSLSRTGASPNAPQIEKPAQNGDEDTLILINGDSLRGSVGAIQSDAISISNGDQERRVALATIREMRFSNPTPAQKPNFRLQLANGSTLCAQRIQWEDGRLRVEWFKSQLEIPALQVVGVEISGTRRVWLSELRIHASVDIPYFDKTWPMRADANAVGGPLLVAAKHYLHGLGLHSAGRWTWQLGGNYSRFRAWVGIDDSAGPLADADFQIVLDGKQIFDVKGIKHGDAARRIDLDISGGRDLMIEVGFGRNGPVQDRVDLVEPALIKGPSETTKAAD